MIWTFMDFGIFGASLLLLIGAIIARAIARKRDPEGFAKTEADFSEDEQSNTEDNAANAE